MPPGQFAPLSRVFPDQPFSVPPSGPYPVPPVIVAASADGTYLIDQYGHPRLFACEDIWALCANAGRYNSGNYQGGFDTYFSQRAAQGYTAAEVSLVSSGDPNDNFPFTTGQDWDGAWPFNGNFDPTTAPNPVFWARRDYLFQSAARNGITVVPNFPGVGPSSAAASWTNAQWTAYGTFLGNRYKNQPNIIWQAGDGTFGAYVSGLASWLTALRATGDTHLVTYQNGDETSSRVGFGSDNAGADPETFDVNAQLDWVYTYNVSYPGVIAAITNEPSASDVVQGRIPVVWGDGDYIGSSTTAPQTDTHLEQNMIWWAMSSGACGWATGDNNIITWDATSPSLVTGTWYATVMPAITSYISSLRGWQKLRPDTSSTLVTAGRGSQTPPISTSGSPYTSNADSYVTAAYAADGSLAVIYGAQHYSITINQSVMQAGYTATWVDPATCATQAATAGSTYNSAPLGNNSTGFADWVLVLQGPATPASTTPSDSDAGSAADSGTQIGLSSSDASSGTDSGVQVTLASPDSSQAADSGVQVALGNPDTSQGSDGGEAVHATLSSSDVSSGADSATQIGLSTPDLSSGADSASQIGISQGDASQAADSGSVPGGASPSDTDAGHGEDSGFTFIAGSDGAQGAEAGTLLASSSDASRAADQAPPAGGTWVILSSDASLARDQELTARPSDGDSGTAADSPWPGVMRWSDTDASAAADQENEQVRVYSFQPPFRWTGGGYDLRHPAAPDRVIWSGARIGAGALELWRTLSSAAEVRFPADSDRSSAESSEQPFAVAVVISARKAVLVSVR